MQLGGHGTAVCLFNLHAGASTLDLDTDPQDVRVRPRPDHYGNFLRPRPGQLEDNDVPLDYSLRHYCSVLYLAGTRASAEEVRIEINGNAVRRKTLDEIVSGEVRNAPIRA